MTRHRSDFCSCDCKCSPRNHGTLAVLVCMLALGSALASAQDCRGRFDILLPPTMNEGGVKALSANGLCAAGWSHAPPYEILQRWRWSANIGFEGAFDAYSISGAEGLSSRGDFEVGIVANSSLHNQPYIWNRSLGLRVIASINNQSATALSVSDDGGVVVGRWFVMTGIPRAFRWTESDGMQDLGVFGITPGEARDISDDGSVIVGWGNGVGAFRWTKETGLQDFGALAGNGGEASAVSGDGRVIVGFTYDQNYRTLPFRWTQADGMKLVPLPDDREGAASDVSFDGSFIVGWYRPSTSSAIRHAFCWSELLGFEDLGIAGNNTESVANAVSDDGEVVAGYMDDGVQSTPFRWIRASADVNRDARVANDDFDMFAEQFGSADPRADFNRDGFVNGNDYDLFAEQFDLGC